MIKCKKEKIVFKEIEIEVGVYVDESNDKKNILFLHGLGSNTLDTFGKALGELPENKLCGIDWLGHGQTTKLLRDKDTYDVQYMNDYLYTVINSLVENNILDRNFSIVANSMSAIPVGYLYQFFEHNIKKIIFLNPAGMDRKMGYIFAFFSKFITKNLFLSWFFSYWIINNKARKVLQKNLKVKDWGKIVSRYADSGYDIFGHMKDTHYVPEIFGKIRKPVLLIGGERDLIFTKREYLNTAIRYNWQIKILGNNEHRLGRGNPDNLASEIKKFLF